MLIRMQAAEIGDWDVLVRKGALADGAAVPARPRPGRFRARSRHLGATTSLDFASRESVYRLQLSVV